MTTTKSLIAQTIDDFGLEFTFTHKCNLAKIAKSGDVWVNIKTGRKATITGNNFRGVMLLHESGRVSQKQHHYFAYDYNPN